MNLIEAYQKLKSLSPLFFTKDAAAILNISLNHASIVLTRLAKQKMIVHLMRGRWAYSELVDPLLLSNILTHPMMSYVSLYSTLYGNTPV